MFLFALNVILNLSSYRYNGGNSEILIKTIHSLDRNIDIIMDSCYKRNPIIYVGWLAGWFYSRSTSVGKFYAEFYAEVGIVF